MQGFPMDSHVTYVTDADTGVITPSYDRAVTSEPLRKYIKGVITNGVLPNPSTNLQVSAGSNGMTVVVGAGFCVIEGGMALEPNSRTLEVTAADPTYDRIDTVVVRWDSNDSVRTVDLYVKAGTPASSPTRPSLTREGSIYELGLADVFVTRQIATITNDKITDTRYENARCGVCDSIAEWDTTTIYRQVQADLARFKTQEEASFINWFEENEDEFDEWFDHMKDQLSEDAAGHLQEEIDDATNVETETTQEPYLFRSSTANAEYDELVGVSVVENQLAGNTNQSSSANNISISFNVSTGKTSVTVSDTPTGYAQLSYPMKQVVQGHKYIIMADKPVANGVEIYYGGTTGVRGSLSAPKNQCVVEEAKSNSTYLQFYCGSTIAVGTYEYYVQTIDLTLAFGSSVADLIYSMEQATAGSGIAYLKSLGLLKDGYKAHNVGTMASSQPVSRVVRGKNLLNKSNLEKGNYNSENFDLASAGSDVYRSIKVYVKAGTYTYSWGKNITMSRLVKDGVMSTALPININTYTVTVNADGYLGISWRDATSSSTPWEYDTPIQLEIGSTATDYEPYKEVTYPLGSDTLRGILTLDGNNIVANGDVKTSDGVITRKYKKDTFTSCWNYTKYGELYYATFYLSATSINNTLSFITNQGYNIVPSGAAVGNSYIVSNGAVLVVYPYDQTITSASDFNTYLSSHPLEVVYPLATPTTEQSTPFAYPQVVMDTEEIVSDVPCGHNAKYVTLPSWEHTDLMNDIIASSSKVKEIEEKVDNFAMSYVGMIIHSTTFDTEAKVKAFYGGTRWIQHSGYVLRGAMQGVVANSATKTGGSDDAVVVSHEHSVSTSGGSHQHTVTVTGGNHAHSYTAPATYQENWDNEAKSPQNQPSGTSATTGYSGDLSLSGTTAASGALTMSGTAASAGESGSGKNVPNYKSVYIWERTA